MSKDKEATLIPMIVTNAEIFLITYEGEEAIKSIPWAIYRNNGSVDERYYNKDAMYLPYIFVVNVERLDDFLASDNYQYP